MHEILPELERAKSEESHTIGGDGLKKGGAIGRGATAPQFFNLSKIPLRFCNLFLPVTY